MAIISYHRTFSRVNTVLDVVDSSDSFLFEGKVGFCVKTHALIAMPYLKLCLLILSISPLQTSRYSTWDASSSSTS
jgi:hypothetical protein